MPKRQSFMVRIHLPINGKYYLWYEVDEERNVKWYLPRDEAEAQEAVQKMLENVGTHMSNFYSNNSEYIKNL